LVKGVQPGEHPLSRDKEGTQPGRVLCVRNVETPSGSRCEIWLADREES
jgi:hypothetical protein